MLSISVVRWIEPQTFQSSPRMMQTDAKSFQWLLTCRQKSVLGTEVWPWDSSWEAPRGRFGTWSLRTIEVFQWPSRKNIPGRVRWDVWKGLESGWRCVCVCVCVCKRVCVCVHVCVLSHVQLFVSPWTVVCQAPLSMEFSRQEYWSGLPCPSPGVLSDPGIKPRSLSSPALAGGVFCCCCFWPTEPPRNNEAQE